MVIDPFGYVFPNLIFVSNDANECRRIELNSRDIDVANSTTIYISFLLFFYILLTVFGWLILFSFIKGLSIWKDVGPCPIGISVFAYERRYHLWGVLTSEI